MSKKTVKTTPITVSYGDGIGPEIMQVVLDILRHAEAKIHIDTVQMGEALYKKGYSSGISDEAWAIIKKNRVLLKAPITTPQGGGYKSLNVTIRKALGLYANVRPCSSYYPIINTHFHDMDVVIVRENEEDVYAGIEYRHTDNVYHCLKIVTRVGCERIIRYAFEYARQNNRKKVTCFTKDNIMKLTDGLFHKTFDEIGVEYQDIEKDHYIIDIGAARLATAPNIFDVIVTLNLYGDIISDIAAEMTGSVGLGGSSNIGDRYAMFEAIHGSAPALIGLNRANPIALINAAIMMLTHIGQGSTAHVIHNALLYTLEQGLHTPDIAHGNTYTTKTVGTDEFGRALIENLGKVPEKCLKPAPSHKDFVFDCKLSHYEHYAINLADNPAMVCDLVGIDVYIGCFGQAEKIGKKLETLKCEVLAFRMLSANGLRVYPIVGKSGINGDHWCARFTRVDETKNVEYQVVLDLLRDISALTMDITRTENLYLFDKKVGFSAVQGD